MNTTFEKKENAGGSATAGGINFQAMITALSMVYTATARKLPWLDGLTAELPISVCAETGGSGDDIRVNFSNETYAEIQVKRGLRKGKRLWDAVMSLANGVSANSKEFGILLICERASSTVKNDLARDIVRMGDNQFSSLKSISQEFKSKLEDADLNVRDVCSRIRIVTVDASSFTPVSVQSAIRDLEEFCDGRSSAQSAWKTLYIDGGRLIETKGKRDLVTITRVLSAEKIQMQENTKYPLSIISHISQWVINNNSEIVVPSFEKPLPISESWIKTQVKHFDHDDKELSITDMLKRYHSSAESDHNDDNFDIEWLGRFVKKCVLIGGPGSGKTTAARIIARRYSIDGYPVLLVKLSRVAARIQQGHSFWEAVLALGLDGLSVEHETLHSTFLPWVIVADGLDECGSQKAIIASELSKLANGNQDITIIVTSRPIGYKAQYFNSWRHYQMLALDEKDAEEALKKFSDFLSDGKNTFTGRLGKSKEIPRELIAVLRRSPLILTLTAVLIAGGQSVQRTRSKQYDAIFKRVEEANSDRVNDSSLTPVVRNFVMHSIGELQISFPLRDTTFAIERTAQRFGEAFEMGLPKARDKVEKAVQYWKEVGLIEQLSHLDLDYYSFIHRTFAEYAAAKYLTESSMSEEQRNSKIEGYLNDENWAEVLEFAGNFGWGDQIASELLSNFTLSSIEAPKVSKCLSILANAISELSNDIINSVFDCAEKIVLSGRRDLISIVAGQLYNAAGRYPNHGLELGRLCLKQAHPWSRVLGYGLLFGAEAERDDVDKAKDELSFLCDLIKTDRPQYVTGVINIDHSLNKLIEVYVVRLIEALAKNLPLDELIEVVSPINSLRNELSIGFWEKVTASFKKHGLKDSFEVSNLTDSLFSYDWVNNSNKVFIENIMAIFSPVKELSGGDNIAPIVKDKLLLASAVLQASGFWHLPLSGIKRKNDLSVLTAEKEAVRGLLSVAKIDPLELASEVAAFEKVISESFENSETGEFPFHKLAHIDIDLLEWKNFSRDQIQTDQLEVCLSESSLWLARIAAALLVENTSEKKLLEIAKRVFQKDGDVSNEMACFLISNLQTSIKIELLLEALKRTCRHAEPLLTSLIDIGVWNQELCNIIDSYLISLDASNAKSAAKVLLKLAPREDQTIIDLAQKGYDHWKQNEKPYPEKSGTVPISPRDNLVKLLPLHSTSSQKLFEVVADSRPDVRMVATEVLIQKLQSDSSTRNEFVERALAGAFERNTVSKIFESTPPFSEPEVESLLTLLNHDDLMWRFVGLGVLRPEYMSEAKALEVIAEFSDEHVPEIIAGLEVAKLKFSNSR